jgi:hypothetical protein
MEFIFLYLLLGVFAGIVAGLFGVGGGLVIVPVLSILFQARGVDAAAYVHLAVGTSLATIVVTSVASMRTHHEHGAVRWELFRQLVPGIVIGALIGAVIADFLPTSALRIIFGVFELAVALQIGFNLMASAHRRLPAPRHMPAVGSIIGMVSSVVGIGGGTLTVPFLIWCNVSIRQAVATSSACGLPISLAGAAGFVAIGWNATSLPPGSTGFLYWPAFFGIAVASIFSAPIGARWAHRLPVDVLRRVFAGFLAILGIRMLLG